MHAIARNADELATIHAMAQRDTKYPDRSFRLFFSLAPAGGSSPLNRGEVRL
jgi:hypothetical protein